MQQIAIISGDDVLDTILFDAQEAYQPLPQAQLYLPTYALDMAAITKHLNNNTMWGKYLRGCIRTWNVGNTVALQVSNAAHGIVGELAEVYDIEFNVVQTEDVRPKILDEIGDAIYYRTIMCYLYGMELDLSYRSALSLNFFQCVMLLSDVGKKAAFHNKIDAPKTLSRLSEAMVIVDSLIKDIIIHSGLHIDEILQYNLDKLNARHNGGKFNPNY